MVLGAEYGEWGYSLHAFAVVIVFQWTGGYMGKVLGPVLLTNLMLTDTMYSGIELVRNICFTTIG